MIVTCSIKYSCCCAVVPPRAPTSTPVPRATWADPADEAQPPRIYSLTLGRKKMAGNGTTAEDLLVDLGEEVERKLGEINTCRTKCGGGLCSSRSFLYNHRRFVEVPLVVLILSVPSSALLQCRSPSRPRRALLQCRSPSRPRKALLQHRFACRPAFLQRRSASRPAFPQRRSACRSSCHSFCRSFCRPRLGRTGRQQPFRKPGRPQRCRTGWGH